MPRFLRNLVIQEVSSVDNGAGRGVKVLLMKRHSEVPELPPAIAAMVKDATAAAVAVALEPFRKLSALPGDATNASRPIVADVRPTESQKGPIPMTTAIIAKALGLDDFDLPEFMAKAASQREVTKAELGELLNRRVAKQRRPEESFAQAYSRCLVDKHDATGSELFRIYMGLPGPDEHQVAARKAMNDPLPRPQQNGAGGQRPIDELRAMAAERRKAEPQLTEAQAFSRILETPAGMELYQADKKERLTQG